MAAGGSVDNRSIAGEAAATVSVGRAAQADYLFFFFSCLAAFFSFIVLAGFFFSLFFESRPLLMLLSVRWTIATRDAQASLSRSDGCLAESAANGSTNL